MREAEDHDGPLRVPGCNRQMERGTFVALPAFYPLLLARLSVALPGCCRAVIPDGDADTGSSRREKIQRCSFPRSGWALLRLNSGDDLGMAKYSMCTVRVR